MLLLQSCRELDPSKYMLLLVVAFPVVLSVAQERVFRLEPGDIAALTNGPVYLNWTTSLFTEDIVWCYWEWSECKKCPDHEFIGYHPEVGGRQNISPRHSGWEFVNKASPCLGGLYRENAKPEHIGWYRMIICTEPKNSYRSKLFELQLYNESDMVMQFNVDKSTENLTLKDGKKGQLELTPKMKAINSTTNITLELDRHNPDTAIVSVTKRNSKGVNFIIDNCIGPGRRFCEFEVLLGEEKEVNIVAEVNTSIQGYPVILIKQAFLYDGTNTNPTSTEDGFSRQTFIALVIVAVCLLVTFIIAVLWIVIKKRQNKGSKIKTNKYERGANDAPEKQSWSEWSGS